MSEAVEDLIDLLIWKLLNLHYSRTLHVYMYHRYLWVFFQSRQLIK